MLDKKSAWRQFCQTGRVEDYLGYLKAQDTKEAEAGEDITPDADHNRWDSNWYSQYR